MDVHQRLLRVALRVAVGRRTVGTPAGTLMKHSSLSYNATRGLTFQTRIWHDPLTGNANACLKTHSPFFLERSLFGGVKSGRSPLGDLHGLAVAWRRRGRRGSYISFLSAETAQSNEITLGRVKAIWRHLRHLECGARKVVKPMVLQQFWRDLHLASACKPKIVRVHTFGGIVFLLWSNEISTFFDLLIDQGALFVRVHALGSIFGESCFLHWSNEISTILIF